MRTMGKAVAVAVVLALGGPADARPDRATVVYHVDVAGLCLHCTEYTVALAADGSGIVHVAGSDPRDVVFHPSPDRAAAFRSRLAPYRPRGTRRVVQGTPECQRPSTDQNTVAIEWQRPGRRSDRLTLYLGCADAPLPRMIRDVGTALRLLPIDADIGRR